LLTSTYSKRDKEREKHHPYKKIKANLLFMKNPSAVVALELVHVVGHLLGLLVPVPVEGVHLLLQAENKSEIMT